MMPGMGVEPPTDAAIDAWAALVRAGQVALAAVEADLKAAGFPPLVWYDALLELRRADKGRLRPKDLERHMLLAQYGISRLVDRLATAGYLTKSPCQDDRRGSDLEITASGRDLLTRMWPEYAAAIQRHVGRHLSAAEAAKLVRLLRRIVA